ncbi:divalent metal cation transporter [Colwellia sp. M166]|uniref:NRAMP family divalent metal transporter n=1 Tax=Colwellia sp. M166 TaxID=2583805 RepID=UPI00211EDE85|nr:divalent metal cation transporter [Colwellia sp. M166]UUO24342.1 divalent metal cation transporter [Colwellia sp. M166]|tara:strand:+ start:39044 stop:40300 length:1257 start_codon:yes stop_codon:yes gene_type:complete
MKFSKIFALLGPGIVWAATSIGVSHIVQATRAGADFGFALLGFIILAHVVKYPFFLFGPKYAGLTGKSLLDGYKSVGNWAFYLFLFLTFVTMFFVQSGVTIVTSALAMNLFGDVLSLSQWAALTLVIVCAVLIVGHYKLLSSLLKWMMLILVISSVIAWFAAVNRLGFSPSAEAPVISLTSAASIAFIVALIGWMPTAIEVSVWHSIWTTSRVEKPGKASAKNATLDFNIGYLTSFLLAIIFLWLGALLMFGQGDGFAKSAAAFAGQLVGIYSTALGEWSWLLMALVTFIALFSTTFAVADGFPQVWRRAALLASKEQSEAIQNRANKVYIGSLLVLAVGSWWIISDFSADIKALLDFVTTVSFVSAPIYAWLNYKVMMGADVCQTQKPQGWFKVYTLVCLTVLTLFSGFFLWWKFFS